VDVLLFLKKHPIYLGFTSDLPSTPTRPTNASATQMQVCYPSRNHPDSATPLMKIYIHKMIQPTNITDNAATLCDVLLC